MAAQTKKTNVKINFISLGFIIIVPVPNLSTNYTNSQLLVGKNECHVEAFDVDGQSSFLQGAVCGDSEKFACGSGGRLYYAFVQGHRISWIHWIYCGVFCRWPPPRYAQASHRGEGFGRSPPLKIYMQYFFCSSEKI